MYNNSVSPDTPRRPSFARNASNLVLGHATVSALPSQNGTNINNMSPSSKSWRLGFHGIAFINRMEHCQAMKQQVHPQLSTAVKLEQQQKSCKQQRRSQHRRRWKILVALVQAVFGMKHGVGDSGGCSRSKHYSETHHHRQSTRESSATWSMRNVMDVEPSPCPSPRPPSSIQQSMARGGPMTIYSLQHKDSSDDLHAAENGQANLPTSHRSRSKKVAPVRSGSTESCSLDPTSLVLSGSGTVSSCLHLQQCVSSSTSVYQSPAMSPRSLTRQLAFDYPETYAGESRRISIHIEWNRPSFWVRTAMVVLFLVFLTLGLYIWAKDFVLLPTTHIGAQPRDHMETGPGLNEAQMTSTTSMPTTLAPPPEKAEEIPVFPRQDTK